MKKQLLFIFTFTILLLSSCNYNQTTDIQGSPSPTAQTIESTSSSDNENNDLDKYEINSCTYCENDINITYPYITGLNNSEIVETINQLLKDAAYAEYSAYNYNSDNLFLEITYDITWSGDNLLSVMYNGNVYHNNAAYPRILLYSINIDISSGNNLQLKNIVRIDDDFVNAFKNIDISSDELTISNYEFILNEYTDDELIDFFNESDSAYENSPLIYSYFTQDALNLIIDVYHMAGDNFSVEINYNDIFENIENDEILTYIS